MIFLGFLFSEISLIYHLIEIMGNDKLFSPLIFIQYSSDKSLSII